MSKNLQVAKLFIFFDAYNIYTTHIYSEHTRRLVLNKWRPASLTIIFDYVLKYYWTHVSTIDRTATTGDVLHLSQNINLINTFTVIRMFPCYEKNHFLFDQLVFSGLSQCVPGYNQIFQSKYIYPRFWRFTTEFHDQISFKL